MVFEKVFVVYQAFNRTLLELKHYLRGRRRRLDGTFNRTLLELKQKGEMLSFEKERAFNRTLLELKL